MKRVDFMKTADLGAAALALPGIFSLARYRTDILGFLSGVGIVLFFLLMLWFFAGVGA